MQIKIGFGFLLLVIIVLGILLWRSNKKLKNCAVVSPGWPALKPSTNPMNTALPPLADGTTVYNLTP